jgi:hypothetical protein
MISGNPRSYLRFAPLPFLIFILLDCQAALAACSSPAGNAGDIKYSSAQAVMAYCNGTSWISMGTNSTTTFGTLTTNDFCTATSGTNIACTTAYTGSGNVVLATSPTIASPTFFGTVTNGTFSGGTWNGSTIAVAYGGTGDATLTAHGVLIGETTSAVAVSAAGTPGQLLIGQGSSSDPSFNSMSQDCTITSAGVITCTKTNNVAFGTLATLNAAPAGTLTGTTLASNVVTSSLTSVGTITSGTWNGTTIAIANGGTNATSQTTNGVNYYNGTSITSGTGFVYTGGQVGIGTATPQGQFTLWPTNNVASADGATLDYISLPAATTTITGTTGIATSKGFNAVSLYRPTYTDSSSVTVTNAATLYIDNAPLQAGSVTITNPYALYVAAGSSYFGGNITTNVTGSTQCLHVNSSGVISGTGSDCGGGGGGTVTSSPAGDVAYYQNTGATVIGTATITISSGQVGIGTSTFAQQLTVNGNIDIFGSNNALLTEIANAGTTGTTVNKLAKLNSSGNAVIAATTDTDGMIGIVAGQAGTSGNAQIAIDGQVGCVFDGTPSAVGDFVTISSSTAGDCHDTGTKTRSSVTTQIVGQVLSTTAITGSTYPVAITFAGGTASSGGNIQSPITVSATSGASCAGTPIGTLGKDGSGYLYVCDNTPSSISGASCSTFASGALSLDEYASEYLCLH